MAVSVGVKTRSSETIVLPVDADRTTVVLAQEPAPPHITQTHADCTPTQLDREPATPLLTPTPVDRHPVPVPSTLQVLLLLCSFLQLYSVYAALS